MAERAHLREAAPLLVTRELTKSFRSLVALRNHHIEVRAGEVVGVIGPNGSGKSTFFNLVTGFLKPNTGVVEFAGAPIQNLPAPAIVRLGIARTFQGTRLFKRLSVIENLRAAAQLRHRLNLVDACSACRGSGGSARRWTASPPKCWSWSGSPRVPGTAPPICPMAISAGSSWCGHSPPRRAC